MYAFGGSWGAMSMHELAFWAQGWRESSADSKLCLNKSNHQVHEDTDVEFCSFIRVVVQHTLVLACALKSTVRYGTVRYFLQIHVFGARFPLTVPPRSIPHVICDGQPYWCIRRPLYNNSRKRSAHASALELGLHALIQRIAIARCNRQQNPPQRNHTHS